MIRVTCAFVDANGDLQEHVGIDPRHGRHQSTCVLPNQSGTVVRGHGGIMDRLDSLCFAAPVYFHLIRFFFTPGMWR